MHSKIYVSIGGIIQSSRLESGGIPSNFICNLKVVFHSTMCFDATWVDKTFPPTDFEARYHGTITVK